jgi:hypothetical protein
MTKDRPTPPILASSKRKKRNEWIPEIALELLGKEHTERRSQKISGGTKP